jgi:hypothetical protein
MPDYPASDTISIIPQDNDQQQPQDCTTATTAASTSIMASRINHSIGVSVHTTLTEVQIQTMIHEARGASAAS